MHKANSMPELPDVAIYKKLFDATGYRGLLRLVLRSPLCISVQGSIASIRAKISSSAPARLTSRTSSSFLNCLIT